jgi:type I restriction enzyme M protein
MFVQSEKFVESHGGKIGDISVYGQEMNHTTRRLAIMNLAIRGIEADIGAEPADTFKRDLHKDLKADFILANPPFNISDWSRDESDVRWKYGVPPKGNANFAWVQHMISSMKPETGRVGVVMPHGVLFRGGAEGAIRKHLIESDLLETVIGLAPNLFYGTTIPASLLFFRATKDKKRKNRVLFIDASKRFAKGKAQNSLTEDDVEDISAAYQFLGETEKSNISARLVSHEEIQDNNWDLNIGRYLKAEAAEIVDVQDALASFAQSRTELEAADKALLIKLKAAGYE